jgi:hypothetical protein
MAIPGILASSSLSEEMSPAFLQHLPENTDPAGSVVVDEPSLSPQERQEKRAANTEASKYVAMPAALLVTHLL